MEIKVYDWEQYNRTKQRYIGFVFFIAFMILISFLIGNISWVVLLFLFLWGYLIFSILQSQKVVTLKQMDEWLMIGEKFIPRTKIHWFLLEMDPETQLMKNIVIVTSEKKYIHTLNDDKDKIKDFVMKLSDRIEMLSDHQQSLMDKIVRYFKL